MKLRILGLLAALVCALGVSASASAAGTVGWSVRSVAEPTTFSPNDAHACEVEEEERKLKCDSYQLLVANVGDEPSNGANGPITLTDKLPAGITTVGTPLSGFGEGAKEAQWNCTIGAGQTTVTCTFAETVRPGHYAPFLSILVSAPSASRSGTLHNEVNVIGGGAAATISTSDETPIASQPPPFSVTEFGFEPTAAGGALSLAAGAHPWQVTTSFGIPTVPTPPVSIGSFAAHFFQPTENLRSAVAELPAGFFGNPQATPRCTPAELTPQKGRACPPGSEVGAFAVMAGLVTFGNGGFGFTETTPNVLSQACCSAIYNMVPERGFPAEFAFTYAGKAIFLYASVVHTPGGYRLRISAPGIPSIIETDDSVLTFFGEPGRLNGTGSQAAFLTNPSDCSAGPLPTRIALDSWEHPDRWTEAQSTAYSSVTGCNELSFEPTSEAKPTSNAADSPSGLHVEMKFPQHESFNETATPPLKDAKVTLPQGLVVNPSSASGLAGCPATGSEGINIGTANPEKIGPTGQDLEDPDATELGEGHAGGNGSPYDDGIYHTAPGHCPAASTLGTVKATTPLLAAPLEGHIYLGAPDCSPCSNADAQIGKLIKLYIELNDPTSGVIVKLPGTVSLDPVTGQVTATFKDTPQFPVSDLTVDFKTGPRAALSTPPACGTYTTTSDLTPWSAPETPDATPSSSFAISEGCGARGFAPSFSAGTLNPQAGGYSPFTLSFSRTDSEQNVSGLTVSLPPGLLGKLAGVAKCPDAALAAAATNAGTAEKAHPSCPTASQLGYALVGTGAGPNPFYEPGQVDPVYLTGPYKGAPYGLAVITPALAGPFDLGTVVVRQALHIDPSDGHVTAISDAFPSILAGIPLQIKKVSVTLDRPQFTFNPTNCDPMAINATLTSTEGTSAAVSSPFRVGGCAGLPFKPSFSVSTQGSGNFHGASLDVKVAEKLGEANIHKVDVQLPVALPSRLATLQKACTETQFAANPAGCPPGSVVGTATAVTPVLSSPLTGPAILVSHGGAAFPDLDIILQGEGVKIVLTGNTDIKKGITYSRFETVPDAPISSFELSLPGGPGAVLAATKNLCAPTTTVTVTRHLTRRVHGHVKHVTVKVKRNVAEPLLMPTTITGQNGAVEAQTTKIAVTGCAKVKPKAKKAKARKTGKRKRR